MLVHTVLFWLKKDLDGIELTNFRIGLETLKHIEHAQTVYIGCPAATLERPVVDTSYDFCLTVILKDLPAHDAYQADPIHQAFLKNYAGHFKKVKVYDAD
ncbi:MAG: Dabb family protein [Verrucomicrobiota bacterium]